MTPAPQKFQASGAFKPWRCTHPSAALTPQRRPQHKLHSYHVSGLLEGGHHLPDDQHDTKAQSARGCNAAVCSSCNRSVNSHWKCLLFARWGCLQFLLTWGASDSAHCFNFVPVFLTHSKCSCIDSLIYFTWTSRLSRLRCAHWPLRRLCRCHRISCGTSRERLRLTSFRVTSWAESDEPVRTTGRRQSGSFVVMVMCCESSSYIRICFCDCAAACQVWCITFVSPRIAVITSATNRFRGSSMMHAYENLLRKPCSIYQHDTSHGPQQQPATTRKYPLTICMNSMRVSTCRHTIDNYIDNYRYLGHGTRKRMWAWPTWERACRASWIPFVHWMW